MQICQFVKCEKFPCVDVKLESHIIPVIEIKPENISMVMISEAAPVKQEDYYYSKGESLLFSREKSFSFLSAGRTQLLH